MGVGEWMGVLRESRGRTGLAHAAVVAPLRGSTAVMLL